MKSNIIAIIAVGVVIVVAVAYSIAGGNLFQSSQTGGVLETAVAKLVDTKTFKASGKVDVNIKGVEGGLSSGGEELSLPSLSNIKAFLNVESAVDQKTRNNLKTSSNFVIGMDADGLQITATLEAITADKKIYVKLVSLPALLLSFVSSLADIQGQWMEIDFNALKEQYGQDVGINMDDQELEEQLKALTGEVNKLLSEKTKKVLMNK